MVLFLWDENYKFMTYGSGILKSTGCVQHMEVHREIEHKKKLPVNFKKFYQFLIIEWESSETRLSGQIF